MPSRIIPGEDLPDLEQWRMPDMADSGSRVPQPRQEEAPAPRPYTAAELEQVQQAARKEGFAKGHEEGMAKGYKEGLQRAQNEVGQRVKRLEALVNALSRPLEDLDERVTDGVVNLAMVVARHVVRRELKTDPSQVIAIVREALGLLPVATPRVQLYLHPEDAALVREVLQVNETDAQWRIVEEPTIGRGGCRVVSESSQIDATVEARVAAVVAQVLGEEREREAGSQQ
jgi:flagellar assembly protein FliH